MGSERNTRVLDGDSPEVVHLKSSDQRLSKVIELIGPIEIAEEDDFDFLVCTIAGQMLSNKVAKVLRARLHECYGKPLDRTAVCKASVGELRKLGLSKAKAETILTLASSFDVRCGGFDFASASDEEVSKHLTTFKGIGAWTAKMFLLFSLQRQDILPYEDGAFLQSYKWLYNARSTKPAAIVRRCKPWRPYSSIAARYMYIALDTGICERYYFDSLGDIHGKATP